MTEQQQEEKRSLLIIGLDADLVGFDLDYKNKYMSDLMDAVVKDTPLSNIKRESGRVGFGAYKWEFFVNPAEWNKELVQKMFLRIKNLFTSGMLRGGFVTPPENLT